MHLIDNAGGGSHQIQIVFSLQSFLNDLQMQQSQKSAPEAKSQCHRSLRFIEQGRIVQL